MEHNPENNGLLFVGKDDNLSSVYIVSKKFIQEGDKFWVTVRFVLQELSQYYQNILVFLKDHDSEYENLSFVEEMWEFEPGKNRHSPIDRSYKNSDGKVLYESTFETPKRILLDKVPTRGMVKQVYEVALDKLFRPVKLNLDLNIRTTNSEGSEVIEIELLNFRAKVTKKVKKNETGVHVIVDQIDPVNKKFIKFAFIFLRNGNLREDLAWGEGKNYDRVAWVNFHNEEEADKYIEEVKQYLIKFEEWLKGDSINWNENIRTEASKDMPKAVRKPPPSRAPVSPVIWLVLIVGIVFVIGTLISDYSKNQKQEKIASEEKAKQEMELNRFKKELEEKSNSSIDTYPMDRIRRRGLPNIYEMETWRKEGEEGLRKYDQDMQAKKLDQINRNMEQQQQNMEQQQSEQQRKLNEITRKMEYDKMDRERERDWDEFHRKFDPPSWRGYR